MIRFLAFLGLFISLYLVSSENLNEISFCENYIYNCTKVLEINGNTECKNFVTNLRFAYKDDQSPIVISKKGLEILLLFETNLCNTLIINTKFINYTVSKYTYPDFYKDFEKMTQNDLTIQLEVYNLINRFNFTKISNGEPHKIKSISFLTLAILAYFLFTI